MIGPVEDRPTLVVICSVNSGPDDGQTRKVSRPKNGLVGLRIIVFLQKSYEDSRVLNPSEAAVVIEEGYGKQMNKRDCLIIYIIQKKILITKEIKVINIRGNPLRKKIRGKRHLDFGELI